MPAEPRGGASPRHLEARGQASGDPRQQRVVAGTIAVLVVVVIGAALLVLLNDDDGTSASPDEATSLPVEDPVAAEELPTGPEPAPAAVLPEPPPGATIEGETPCPAADGSEQRVASLAQPPPPCIVEGEDLEAEVITSKGPIVVALDAESAPVMVNNFVVLARYKYFDGLPFHRLVPDFVAQTGSSGIPDYGSGGPGYSQSDIEKPTDGYRAGDVAMARAAEVSGSQFFLVASEAGAAGLTNEYPLFGRVTEGMDLVAELASLGDQATNGTPTEVVTMESVTIRPAA